jgi:hypothetical protein
LVAFTKADHVKLYRQQIGAAVRAARVHSRTCYSWFGERSVPIPATIKKALDNSSLHNILLSGLERQLYLSFYSQGWPVPASLQIVERSPSAEMSHVQALSQVNRGTGFWDDGWTLLQVSEGHIVARKLNLNFVARHGLYEISGERTDHARVVLRLPKESFAISPGFYVAFSDNPLTEVDSSHVVRFYWNVTPAGALKIMHAATLNMNREGIRFRLKVLKDPLQYSRCDAAVLYLVESDLQRIYYLIEEIYSELLSHLKPAIPAFTKEIAAGVGFAQDPGMFESFGMNRCRILADGIIQAHEQGATSFRERVRIVESCFAKKGISLDAPFLNSGSQQPFLGPFTTPSLPFKFEDNRRELGARDALARASRIAQLLCRRAIWHGKRCSWVGGMPKVATSGSHHVWGVFGTLGPEMYSGTSGVALFLADLYSATGDHVAANTARAAIRQALFSTDAVPSRRRLGLYTGWVGIALVAARLGGIFADHELLVSAFQLVERLKCEDRDHDEFDFISGRAGAIVGLVLLSVFLHDPDLTTLAVSLGDELIELATKSVSGWSWAAPALRNRPHLTGLSHGAAGAGYAFAELYRRTGDSKYRESSIQAFRYERRWFSPKEGNWVDLRWNKANYSDKDSAVLGSAWCHGAPGIALSRLCAYESLRDETCKIEASIALATTTKLTRKMLESRGTNFCLCHGLAGNADVLLCGAQIVGQDLADSKSLAIEVAQQGAQCDPECAGNWPGCTDAPGLMIGWAGIGYFYLRLSDQGTPSPLFLRS